MNEYALNLDGYPAYIYDLPGLEAHVRGIRAALPNTELFYAAKANPDAEILRTLAPHVDGIEVSSGGELAHVRKTLPDIRIAFGGPGKTPEELRSASHLNVDRIHVESPRELSHLPSPASVLLRANLPLNTGGAALTMSGPFGMDEDALDECARRIARTPHIDLRGVHAHLASGLDAPAMLDLAAQVADWALSWLESQGVDDPELNVGGGMAVDYANPDVLFDWAHYGQKLPESPALRIEPGRAITAYHGWYVTDVLDVKTTRGETYVILRGGTHHLRTPVTKGHNQPFEVLTATGPESPATLVGQLCTPKDVFARDVPVPALAPGDVIAFTMAGAYAWNISHHDFLMHPKPSFHYLNG
ncbi:type III PLP-dependent enzyme [Actinomadura darangshiensis]|uniref:Type III PLP-dependent enzyme n=1 Tax=Actinomadura darangshiensis TaxID=705336 RepID=A0A4R5BCB2_9ACTN|nr:type III PLP-dependent enzyme [Actinomadura darangshiensis]TDD81404.1 type III PLP-dependent enzyme [Actinomadura darangshiensis]